MNLVPLILDVVAVGIVLFYVIVSAKKGFITTILDFLGYILSFFAAVYVGKLGSIWIYDSFIAQKAYDKVFTVLESAVDPDQWTTALQSAFDSVPQIFRNILNFGDHSIDNIVLSAEQTTQNIATVVTDQIIAPAVMACLMILIFIVSFSICLFLVRRIARLFRGVNYIPIIGQINAVLGGVAGVFQGMLVVYILSLLFKLIFMVFGNGVPLLSPEIIGQTWLFSQFYNFNILPALSL